MAVNDAPEHRSTPGPETERRCAQALAMLAEHPTWRRVIVAEAGEPVIVGIAICGVGYGEVEIPVERYDAPTLLEIMDRYSFGAVTTVQ